MFHIAATLAHASAGDPTFSMWQNHPEAVLGSIVAILLQAALISMLLAHRKRRRQVEEALRLSEERYRAVVDSQSEMVCRYRPDTTLTFVNEAYGRFFGRTREQLLGTKFLALIPEEKHAAVLEVTRRLAETHQPILHEHEVLRPDGSLGWMEWQDVAILDANGHVQELQGIGRDITERRRAADALAESERNLTHASRLALVGELTASIAHEINQPLGAILNNAEAAEMLLERGKVDEVKRILADIRKDDLRASEVILHVRSLVGKHAPEYTSVGINKMVKTVLSIVAQDARRRRVTLTTQLAADLPELRAERVQLKQALLNLIINAMDSMAEMPAEEREVVIRTGFDGKMIEIEVADRGHGIPADRLSHIFESFFTTKKNGMGLGLAMVRSIAETHRGWVTVENNPSGKGATFSLHLPANSGQTQRP